MKRQWLSWPVFTALCGLAGLVFAADVSDFQTASENEGCSAIPYQYTRNECERYKIEVDTKCKGKTFGHKYDEVAKLIDKIKEKKRNLDEAKARNNRSAIPDLEDKIAKLREQINKIKAVAFGKKSEAEDCLNARLRVQRVFKDATTSVRADGRDYEELKPYADILEAKYVKGAAEHAQAIVEARNGKEGWQKVIDATVP